MRPAAQGLLIRISRRWLRALVVPVTLIVIAGNLGSLNRRFDLLSNVPVQMLWASALVTAGLVWVRSWKFAAVGALCTATCASHVLPWYLPARLGAAAMASGGGTMDPARLRIMLHNVWQPNTQYELIMDQVRKLDADLVVLQEVDERWFSRLAPLANDYPHVFHSPGGRFRGMVIFSRHPLMNVREVVLNNPLSPTIVCDLDFHGQRVAILCTHPWPPIGEEMTRSRNEQLRLTGDYAAGLTADNTPAIVIGDLNTGMWSPHYKQFERLSGMTNVRRGFGILATHPMNDLLYPRVPIDHILVSSEIEVRNTFRGEACGSDHAALIADVVIRF